MEARQHRNPTLERCGDDHPIGFQATKLARRQVSDDDNFASNKLFRLVGECDTGDDLAYLETQVNFEPQ